MPGIVRQGAFNGAIKRLLSALRLVEKRCRLKPLVREANWLFDKAVSKFKLGSGTGPVK